MTAADQPSRAGVHVLVTGGAGFIGANLCTRLVRDAAVAKVTVLDDLSTGFERNLDGVDSKVRLVVGSILDRDVVGELVADSDAVVHLAARPSVPRSVDDPMSTHLINVDGTMTLLEACRRRDAKPHFVFASSSSVYGSNPELPKHEGLATRPMSPYAASKLAGESYVLAYQACFGIPAVAFRFFNVFGPLQPPGHAYAAAVPAFIDAALAGRPIPIFGDGTQTRDFTYVATVVDVLARTSIDRIAHPSPVNLAFGTRTSLLEVVGRLERVFGRSLECLHHPTRPGDVRDSQAANAALTALMPGLDPTELDQGLAATVEWMRQRTP